MNEDSYLGRNSTDPEFNSGIAYLQRIHNLILYYQISIKEGDLDGAYNYAKEWHNEIYPRMKKEQRAKLEIKEKKTDGLYIMPSRTSATKKSIYLQLLRDYTRELHVISHELKLVMPNKQGAHSALLG